MFWNISIIPDIGIICFLIRVTFAWIFLVARSLRLTQNSLTRTSLHDFNKFLDLVLRAHFRCPADVYQRWNSQIYMTFPMCITSQAGCRKIFALPVFHCFRKKCSSPKRMPCTIAFKPQSKDELKTAINQCIKTFQGFGLQSTIKPRGPLHQILPRRRRNRVLFDNHRLRMTDVRLRPGAALATVHEVGSGSVRLMCTKWGTCKYCCVRVSVREMHSCIGPLVHLLICVAHMVCDIVSNRAVASWDRFGAGWWFQPVKLDLY